MVNVFINGKKESISENSTVKNLLEFRRINPQIVTVELNEKILNKQDFDKILIKENDKIEFVYFMGGGSTRPPKAASLTIYKESNHPERGRMK